MSEAENMPKKETVAARPIKAEGNEGKKIAVIRVRGSVRVAKSVNYTLDILGLSKKNSCVLLTKKDFGMIQKVKDYVTYGEIDKETEELLRKERTEKVIGKDGKEKTKKTFRLNPPKKGFGRKGIKFSFTKGGALGDRKEKINDLIKRML